MLYFIHYLIGSFKFTADEIRAEVQHQFLEVKMDFNTIDLSKKNYGPTFWLSGGLVKVV